MPVENPESGRLALLLGVAASREFAVQCGSLLAQADARRSNPIDGRYARVERGNRLGGVAADLLVVCGLMRDQGVGPDGSRLLAITELGDSAYGRLERSWGRDAATAGWGDTSRFPEPDGKGGYTPETVAFSLSREYDGP